VKQKKSNVSPILSKAARIIKYLFFLLVILFLLLVAAANLPFVHTFLTQKTNTILAEKGIPAHVGKITLLLNGKIGISQLEIIKPGADTVIYAGKASVDLRPLPLLSRKIAINSIYLSDIITTIQTDSVTGEINIVSVFKTTGSTSKPKAKELEPADKKPWDIEVANVQFKNIRFTYSDPASGILVKQNLKKADIDFKYFSLLKKQIDVKSLEITEPAGLVAIWKTEEKVKEENNAAPTWKFSLQQLEINDFKFTLDQPDSRQSLEVVLKSGIFSLEKLDLATREIIVGNIELNNPVVTFISNNEGDSSKVKMPDSSVNFSIPKIPWTIFAKKLQIKEGVFSIKNSESTPSSEPGKIFPLQHLNASFSGTKLSPEGYSLNLEKISFALANTLKIQSGSMQFNTDSLQNVDLKLELAALINKNKKGWFTKDSLLQLTAAISGSTEQLNIEKIGLNSSSGLSFQIGGTLLQPIKMQKAECDLHFSSGTISRMQLLPVVSQFSPKTNLPMFSPFSVSGSIKNSLEFPVFTLKGSSGSGNIIAEGNYDIQNSKGNLDASFSELLLSELLGQKYPEKLSGKLHVDGDINRSKTPEGEVLIEIDSLKYKNNNIVDLTVQAVAQNNEVIFSLVSADSALNCNLNGSLGWTNQKSYTGALKGNFDIDLYKLYLYKQPFAGKGNIDACFGFSPEGITSIASINDLAVRNKNASVTIKKTKFDLNTTDSLIVSNLESDFLNAHFKSRASFADFKNAFESTRLEAAINLDSTNFINLNALSNLAFFSVDATAQHHSAFNLFFPDSVLNFSDIKLNILKNDINSRAEATLSTKWIKYNLITSYSPQMLARIEPDRLSLNIKTDSITASEIKFGKLGFNFDVLPASIVGNLEISDKNDSILHQIGFAAQQVDNEVVFTSATPFWLINRIPWTLSPPQFLTFNKLSKKLIASLDLNSGEKSFRLMGSNTDKIELDLRNIELSNLAIPGIIGFVPDGIINGNIIYSKTEQNNLELNMEMSQLKWNNIHFKRVVARGSLVADSTGIPNSKLLISADDSLSIAVQVNFNKLKNEMQLKSNFNKLQFQLFEPFIKEYASNLHGTSSGEIALSYKEEKFAMDGEFRFNNFGLKIIPLKTWLTIPDNKIELKQNQFVFNNFAVIDSLNRPLIVNGKIDFVNSENINVDLNVKADKISFMNTTESKDAPLYGTIIVNSNLTIGGSIYSPEIKGNIDLESGTNLTYQLIQDLSVAGSQTDVVFATITDSLQIIYPESGMVTRTTKMPNIETTININPKSIFNVKINDLYNVDITISGDGRLNYNMLPNNTMSLNGNYQIKTGDCKLKITGWPLKNFSITPGSSFNWNGSVENPELNLEATTKVKGSYMNPIDNKNRLVDFVVTMQLKNQLSNLAIIFGIQSSDQYISNVVSSLSSDEMMRQAINLLLFETLEIPGVESSSNYFASQISSFWESQLNSLTSNKLNKTKLSFGIDTYNQSNSSGGQEEKTSVTYEMEHKFMKDRATFKVSGKLNDYNQGTYQTNSLFENFTFEYSLDSLNTKNIKLYQKRDYEDMLEGQVTKYGAGFLYRKNYKKLSDIWRREKKSKRVESKNNLN